MERTGFMEEYTDGFDLTRKTKLCKIMVDFLRRTGMKTRTALVPIICFVVTLAIIGWGLNIVKLCQCDFKQPVKAEFIRAVGIFVPPVGAVMGYFEINDDKVEGEPE